MADQPGRPFFTVETPMKYALMLGAVFLLPILNTWLLYSNTVTPEDVAAASLASLVFVNPLATLAAGALYAWRHGFLMILPWLFGLVFIPSALVAFNETALVFAIVYVLFGYLGQCLGLLGERLVARMARNRV